MISRVSLRRSLNTRVTLFTLAIFTVSLWLLSFYTSHMLQEDMQRMLGEQQFLTASRVAGEINNDLIERTAALELIAKEIEAPLIGNPAALQARLDRRPILSIMFNDGTWISGLNGNVIASNLPVLIGTNYADQEYLMTVLKGGKSAISKPVTSKVLKDPIFVMAVPIRDAAGKVIGAVAGVTDLSKANFLDGTVKGQFGKSGGFVLNAPQYRLIVTATDKSRIMQLLPPPGVNTMLDRYIQGYEGYGVSINSRGVEELTAAKGIPIAGWFMGVVIPTAEAFAPVYDMQQRMLWATILLTLLAGGLTWWMLRMQLAPMLNTARTLARMATSKQPAQALPITRQDEVGDMVAGFNHLLEILNNREVALTKNEAELRVSETRFRTLFAQNNAVFLQIEPSTGQILDANEAASAFYGWAHDELVAKTIQDINQLNEDEIAAERQAALNQHRSYFVFPHLLANGDIRTVEVHSTPVEVSGRKILVSIIHDITERRAAEDRVGSLLAEQKAILHSEISGIVKLKNRKFVWMNASFATMLGYTVDELLNQPTRIVYPSDEAHAAFAAAAYPGMLRGEVFRTEIQYQRKDRSLGWYNISGEQLYQDSDESIWSFVDITEHKQAEAAVRESETRFRLMADSAPVLMWTSAQDKLCNWFNKVWLKFTGRSMEQEMGSGWAEGVHPDDLNRCLDTYGNAFDARHEFTMEYRLRRFDGEYRWLVDTGVPRFDADGMFMGYIGSCIDIADRKNAEIELVVANTELSFQNERIDTLMREQKAILQNDLIGIVTVRDRKIIWANPAFETMLGYGPGELVGAPTSQNHPSEQASLAFGAVAYPVLAAGHVFRSQIEHRRKDGTCIWVDLSASLISPNDGVSLWSFTDITKSKMIAEQIAQSEATLRDLFDAALDAVISMDAQGRITGWNRQAESMFGWSKQEAVGLTLHDTIAPPKHRAAHQFGLTRFLATGQSEMLGRRIELSALRRSGEEFPVELSILPFKRDGVQHFTAFIADTSARKLAEELVRKLAYYDPLTGLANRMLLKDRLIQSMMASDRSRHYGALMFIDLDNFKPVNDLHGHAAGDLVLIEVAKRLKNCFRQIDTVSRIGGDEFVVLLDDLTADREQSQLQAGLLAEKVRANLTDVYELDFHLDETQPSHRIEHHCSASIGVVLFLGLLHSEEEILKLADIAMYQAKDAGRNSVRFYEIPT